ncbi:hypothetical protein [Halosegnis marinus]|uniref:Uncharacterized protein n=1 Tax=Halosegnis marinus TaxID=3034023 RepID=A0ABD5ZTQ8_9EURY|nr:hypothetical protein [Halosegnis sp. DT85]
MGTNRDTTVQPDSNMPVATGKRGVGVPGERGAPTPEEEPPEPISGPRGTSDGPHDAHPALRNLNDHQRRAIGTFTDGFADRRALLEWMLRFQYCSFGRLADRIYFALADTHERTTLAALCHEPARTRVSPAHDLTDAAARAARHRLRSRYLRPAALAAYRELRTSATEYAVEANPPDPDKSPFFALRPAFEEYFALQTAALESFLDGFTSVRDVEAWFQRLDHATWGEIRNVPGGDHLEHRILSQRAARGVLVDAARRPSASASS